MAKGVTQFRLDQIPIDLEKLLGRPASARTRSQAGGWVRSLVGEGMSSAAITRFLCAADAEDPGACVVPIPHEPRPSRGRTARLPATDYFPPEPEIQLAKPRDATKQKALTQFLNTRSSSHAGQPTRAEKSFSPSCPTGKEPCGCDQTQAAPNLARAPSPLGRGTPRVWLGFERQPAGPVDESKRVWWEPDREQNGHLVALGGSGSGKTEMLRVILAGIQSARVPSLVLDFHGDMVVAGQLGYRLTGTPVDQVGINPLELYSHEVVDGGPVRQKADLVDAIIRAAKGIGYLQKTELGEAILEAYRRAGITQEPATWRKPAPTLELVLQVLKEWLDAKKKPANSLRGIIAAVSDAFGDPVFSRRPYLSLAELLHRGVRLNLASLRRPSQILIVDTVLRQVFAALKAQGIVTGPSKFRLFVVIDEASLLKGAEILNILIQEARKFGLGLILASQEADHFASGVRSNAATLIVLKTNLASEAAANAKQLRGLRTQDVLSLTGPGDGYLRDHAGTRRIQVVPLDFAGRTRGPEPEPLALPLAKRSELPADAPGKADEASLRIEPGFSAPAVTARAGAAVPVTGSKRLRVPRLPMPPSAGTAAPSSLPAMGHVPPVLGPAEAPASTGGEQDETRSAEYQERYAAGRVWIASKTKKPPGPGQLTRWAPIVQQKLAAAATEAPVKNRAFWSGVRDFLAEAAAGSETVRVSTASAQKAPPAYASRVERAFRLRKLADSLTAQIGQLRESGTSRQRPTARRARILGTQEKRAEHLENVQASMRGLADALEGKCEPASVQGIDQSEPNCVPASLEGIDTKTIVEELLTTPNFPRPGIRRSWITDALAGTVTLRSLSAERARVEQIRKRCGEYWCGIEDLGDVASVERVAAALKQNPKTRRDAENALAELQGFKRALAAGIASQEEWVAAREALQRLGTRGPRATSLERQVKEQERALIGVPLPGYFPTPSGLARRVVQEAQIAPGQRVLEPEAGKGDLAEAVRAAGVEPQVIEAAPRLVALLELKGFQVVGTDFLAFRDGGYDRIVMNPPFERNADIEHVRHAYSLLAPGGKLVAIMSEGAFFRTGTTEKGFREWLDVVAGRSEKLPDGSFRNADRSTGVAVRLVIVNKPASAAREPIPRNVVAPGPRCPPENPSCKLGLLGGVCGLPASLVLSAPGGTPQSQVARFCLASAKKLIPSHNPQNFSRRKDYPEEVQERRYEASRAEQLKVLRIAGELNPALVFNTSPSVIDGGTPVVTEEGIALGGNGRLMALQLHYSIGATAAKEYLVDHAGEFGFTAEQVAQLPDPVVVRVLDTGADRLGPEAKKKRLQQLVRLLNVSLSQDMDAKTNAVALARQLDDQVFGVLAGALDGEVSLAEYLSSRQSQDLAKQLRRVGVITEQNQERFLAEGVFTDEGKRLVEKALAATLVPSAELIEALGEQVSGTLARGAPPLLAASHFGSEWDLRPALLAAARDYLSFKRGGSRDLRQFLRQEALIPGEGGLASGVPGGVELLQVLQQLADSPLKFSRFARFFANDARSNQGGQGALFASEKVTPLEAIRRAAAQVKVELLTG